jgi:hypothetical protein
LLVGKRKCEGGKKSEWFMRLAVDSDALEMTSEVGERRYVLET